ncbi:MAG TPA: VanZ family protein [Vicinamibacterales bacterium]
MKLWKWWVLVVFVVSGPWYGVTRTPQWSRVTWIPFHGREDKPSDVAANFALWLPFGWSFAARRRGGARLMVAGLAALGFSAVAETSQLFFVMRDPSATDVFVGMLGSAAGSLAAQAFDGSDARGPQRRVEAGERGSD